MSERLSCVMFQHLDDGILLFQDLVGAVELATQVLSLKPDSFEAFYARAKGRVDLK